MPLLPLNSGPTELGSQRGSHLLNHSMVQFSSQFFLWVNSGTIINLTLKRGLGDWVVNLLLLLTLLSISHSSWFPTELGESMLPICLFMEFKHT